MNQPHSQHESNVQADTRVDNYALDDTLAGRITQSAAAGLMLSFPDWIKNKTALSITYVFSFIGFGALVAITNAQREDEEPQAEQNDSDLKQWAVFAAVILLFVLGGFINVKVSQAVVKRLRKRGLSKPWTAWGAIAAAFVFLVSELEARDIEKLAA
ncbi:hypothetical protein I6I11_09790 [Corynebacterium striatum]|uniref:Uncharacterized protein n=1 Tax=Corynebacterium striatum TaxID=43770 RepID=A0ABC9ZJR1_CORST|nr:hypothetical protein [Corynebacterium striatum]MDK8807204.1 hypothetical protein [Corynebacterium striatum]QQE52416.1 hypothetical protein I6I11_09790 [Corynebacterium striatum]QQU78143.1 hypothetical protein I6I72_06545 [Corynebacterium striatum]GEA42347.1 hypothetical protein Cst04h_05170 [Corynebacterium striatum]HCG3140285.1 hypothetical protein [Corynebacterium striatum]